MHWWDNTDRQTLMIAIPHTAKGPWSKKKLICMHDDIAIYMRGIQHFWVLICNLNNFQKFGQHCAVKTEIRFSQLCPTAQKANFNAYKDMISGYWFAQGQANVWVWYTYSLVLSSCLPQWRQSVDPAHHSRSLLIPQWPSTQAMCYLQHTHTHTSKDTIQS